MNIFHSSDYVLLRNSHCDNVQKYVFENWDIKICKDGNTASPQVVTVEMLKLVSRKVHKRYEMLFGEMSNTGTKLLRNFTLYSNLL